MAAERILDSALGHLVARALVAIARADDQIGLEEGLRLQQRIERRTGSPSRCADRRGRFATRGFTRASSP